MSDIYLELRSRIPVVAAKTTIGSARLQEAQDATGLSNESIARLIPVSEKTWRRWKESGEIPTASLPAVAAALRLELKQAERVRVEVGSRDGNGPEVQPVESGLGWIMQMALRNQEEMKARLDQMDDRLGEIAARLEEVAGADAEIGAGVRDALEMLATLRQQGQAGHG